MAETGIQFKTEKFINAGTIDFDKKSASESSEPPSSSDPVSTSGTTPSQNYQDGSAEANTSINNLEFGPEATKLVTQATIEKDLADIVRQANSIKLAAGTRLYFNELSVHESGYVQGKIRINSYAMANMVESESANDINNYKHSVVFELKPIKYVDPASGKDKWKVEYHDPLTGITHEFSPQQQMQIIRNTVNKVSAATKKLEDDKTKPYRSMQKMEQTFIPDVANLQSFLLLDSKPTFPNFAGVRNSNDVFAALTEKKILEFNRQLEKDGDRYRIRKGPPETNPPEASLTFRQRFWKAVIPNFLHKRLGMMDPGDPDPADPNDKGNKAERDKPKLIDRDAHGVPKVNFFGWTQYKTFNDRNAADATKAKDIYSAAAGAAGILSGFQVYHFQKYEMTDPNNKVSTNPDTLGQELDSQGNLVPDKQKSKWQFFKEFLFDDAGAGQITDFKLEKDDDLCRAQLFLSKQISHLKYLLRYIKDYNYWNRTENRSFVELALGEHRHDTMTQTCLETLRLADSFAFDHRTAQPGKRLWSTSGFVGHILNACDPTRGKMDKINGVEYRRPTSLGILNIHFSKLWNINWIRGGFGCHWYGSEIACGESLLLGNFKDATFTNCKLGNSWAYGIIKNLGMLLGGKRSPKAAIGFSGDYDPSGEPTYASDVVFDNSSVGGHTAFYGGISSGEFKVTTWRGLFSKFTADCQEMDVFKMRTSTLRLRSFRFGFASFDGKKTELDDFIKNSLVGTPYTWHRIWIHNAEELKRIILDENAKARKLAEKQFYLHTSEWVPNSIRGAGYRLCFPATAKIAGEEANLNNSNVELMFYNHSIRNPIANSRMAQGYIRIVADDLNTPKWIRNLDDKSNYSAVGLLLRASSLMACPTTVDMFSPKG